MKLIDFYIYQFFVRFKLNNILLLSKVLQKGDMAMSNKNSSLGCLSVSDRQMKKFYELKDRGIINHDNFQKFLENPDILNSFCSIYFAIASLGKDHVVTHKQSSKLWVKAALNPKPRLLYSQKTIEQAAQTNKSGVTNYYLVYCHGLSLLEQAHNIEINNKWFLVTDEAKCITKKFDAGYYLIDMKARHGNATWAQQAGAIQNWGSCERALGACVSELLFAVYKIHGKRLLEDCYHWSELQISNEDYLYIGGFNENGIQFHPRNSNLGVGDTIRAVSFRKYDNLER